MVSIGRVTDKRARLWPARRLPARQLGQVLFGAFCVGFAVKLSKGHATIALQWT
jgi:hypothetical protein